MFNRLIKGAGIFLVVALAACGEKQESPKADTSEAPASATESQDLETLSRYELTMDDLHKWAQANSAVSQVARKRPELEEKMSMSAEDASIDALSAKLSSDADVKQAIESNGLSTRRFAIITYTIMQIAMAQMALQQGVPADSFATKAGINSKNLEFYEANRVEIDELMQKIQADNNNQSR